MENKFEYTYSATENEEIKRIRKKYMPQTPVESKYNRIKKLDKSVETGALTFSLVVGILGALIFGVGMCCILVWKDLFVPGIAIGITGMIICGCAYPLYKKRIPRKRGGIHSSGRQRFKRRYPC